MATIYDWPSAIQFQSQAFMAGGQSGEGLITLSGVRAYSPEPGGLAWLDCEFYTSTDRCARNRLASWLMSRIMNGAVFRVPIVKSAQLANLSDLGITIPEGYLTTGIPWEDDDGGDVFFDDGTGWLYEGVAPVNAAAAKGSTTLTIDMSALNETLDIGHVIGLREYAYEVMAISYLSGVATVTLSQPLRESVTTDFFVSFRPTFLGQVINPESFHSVFDRYSRIQPGAVRFVEALP